MAKKLNIEKEVILWKDRKRILGLPISFTRYEASKDRMTMRRGFFRTETEEILIYRIMDIRLVRTFGQKLCGVGTITLISSDKTTPTLELKNIRRSDKVRRFLSNLIEQQRSLRGIVGSELLGVGRAGHAHGHGQGHEYGQTAPCFGTEPVNFENFQ